MFIFAYCGQHVADLLFNMVWVYKDYETLKGVHLWQTGVPVTLEEAQANQGFAFVEESTLEELLIHKKVDIPSEAACSGDKRLEFIFAVTCAVVPTWTAAEAIKAVHKGFK